MINYRIQCSSWVLNIIICHLGICLYVIEYCSLSDNNSAVSYSSEPTLRVVLHSSSILSALLKMSVYSVLSRFMIRDHCSSTALAVASTSASQDFEELTKSASSAYTCSSGRPLSGEVFVAAFTNTPDDARADIRAWGAVDPGPERLHGRSSISPWCAFLCCVLAEHERRKKSEFAERIINMDRGTFTPLIFTTAGCCAPECSRFIKRLCGLLSRGEKKKYAEMTTYVRCRLAFELLRSTIMCIRGARSSHHRLSNALRKLAVAEGRLWMPERQWPFTSHSEVWILYCSCLKLVVLWLDSFHVGFGHSAWRAMCQNFAA